MGTPANWGLLSEQAWGRGLGQAVGEDQPGSEVLAVWAQGLSPPALAFAAWVTPRQDHQPPLGDGGAWRHGEPATGGGLPCSSDLGARVGAHILSRAKSPS